MVPDAAPLFGPANTGLFGSPNMARTRQLASGLVTNGVPMDEEDKAEINSHLTEKDLQKRAELEQAPMQAELKHLEKRWTKKGTPYLTEPKEDEDVPEEKINWYEKFALCVTHQYDGQNQVVTRTSLQVNSPALKAILKDVIGIFPGQSFHTSQISIDFPPRSLYHYREELQNELKKHEPQTEAASHLPILLDFINEHFEDTIADGDNLRAQGLVSYEHLWTIFKPGSIIYSSGLGQPRAFELVCYQYVCGQNPGLQLTVNYVDYDGDGFGTRSKGLLIPPFKGAAPIVELNAFPMHFHPLAAPIEIALVARGRQWEAHAGQNFRHYKGIALDPCRKRYNIDGRVMIDAMTFHRLNPNNSFDVSPFPGNLTNGYKRQYDDFDDEDSFDYQTEKIKNLPPLTEQQCLLASNMVRGFSFTEKKFLDFFIEYISPINWNTECFKQLVLPASQKELVQALVAEHTARSDPTQQGFDDIVKGKGKGLIICMHGPPGVGKTLTAECVAEFSRRPLYIVSSGELGNDSEILDNRLSRVLDLASTFRAVLLVDEADVFLERREVGDIIRNSMVSIFLRTLEYYSGILFMTTNRVSTFDDAFKSRIHVPLKYDELSRDSRAQIWKNFVSKTDGGVDIDEAGYQTLAESPLNGRQIKNVVRTAKSLAAYKKRKLDHEQLQQVMKIQMVFENELAKGARHEEMVVVANGV